MVIEAIYSAKPDDYFSLCREELKAFIPEGAHAILELGCGSGRTGMELKRSGRATYVTGIEINPDAGRHAMQVLDKVVVGNVDSLDWSTVRHDGGYDYVLATDVLEHLVDPWAVVEEASHLLKAGGRFVAIVPNVRCLKVVLPLVFHGGWDYQSWGLLDKGHIRFFTKSSLQALFTGAGLSVEKMAPQLTRQSKSGKLNRMTFRLFEDFITPHYLVIAHNAAALGR